MKRLFFIGAVAMLALSCSSDDDSGNLSNASIEGTWKLTKYELGANFDLNNDGTATNNVLAETSCFSNSSLAFGTNNTGTFTFASANFNLELVQGSETEYEYVTDCGEASPDEFTYFVSDNLVTINENTSFIRSGKRLIVAISAYVPIVENGEITDMDTSAYLEFTKQ